MFSNSKIQFWFATSFSHFVSPEKNHPVVAESGAQLSSDHFQMLPSEDFMGLDDYIECLGLCNAHPKHKFKTHKDGDTKFVVAVLKWNLLCLLTKQEVVATSREEQSIFVSCSNNFFQDQGLG